MIRDLVKGAPASLEPSDVCIIGAGAAGIVLAVELARQGKRVTLLEGGGPEVEQDSQDPYRSEISGLNHDGVHIGRFRSNGGSTTRWGGQILELDDLDFEQRPWVAGSGWPIAKQHLRPFYQRAIELAGLSQATLDDARVWQEIGLPAPEFPEFETFFSRWCPETNFARLHGKTLVENPCITIWLHANALGPVLEGQRICGIRCKTLTGVEHTFHADRFVWCMGGIESSRFFLQPELAAMPWHRSGLLGRHFQDHIIATAARIEVSDATRFHAAFDNVFSRGYKYQPKIRLGRAQQEKHGTLNVAALIFFNSDSDAIGGEIKATAKKLIRGRGKEISRQEVLRLFRNAPLLAHQSWRYVFAHRAYVPPDAHIELGIHCEQPPEGTSSITLAATRDQLGMLRTRINWQISDLEIASIRTCVDIAAESLRKIAKVVPDPDLIHHPDRFLYKCGDGYHHMGGMRMSVSPDKGVVDLDLKLHGIENGYVCSAAVFPTSGFSNPTHTVLALTVRLADHLSQQ